MTQGAQATYIAIPAPISLNLGACSKRCTLYPCLPSPIAVRIPPIPPPTTAMVVSRFVEVPFVDMALLSDVCKEFTHAVPLAFALYLGEEPIPEDPCCQHSLPRRLPRCESDEFKCPSSAADERREEAGAESRHCKQPIREKHQASRVPENQQG